MENKNKEESRIIKNEELKTSKKERDNSLEVKELKVKHLQDEIDLLQLQLKSEDLNELIDALPNRTLRAEISNLEKKIIQQLSQQARLEDKYQMMQKSYKNASKVLEKSHHEVMDSEELAYIAECIETKKNELLSARNLITEIQKIGYTNMPPKIVDECKKTQIELDYIQSTLRKLKEEAEEAVEEVKVNHKELQNIQEKFHNTKELNFQLEYEIDEIVEEIETMNKLINSKEKEADELITVVNDIQGEIDNKKIEIANLSDEKNEKIKSERLLQNKEIDDLLKKQKKLQKKIEKKETILLKKQNLLKSAKIEQMDVTKYNLADLKNEYALLLNETENLKEYIKIETKLKMEYFNIIADMLGQLKIVCRSRGGTSDNVIKVLDDNIISLKTKSEHNYNFDYCFGPESNHSNILDVLNYLYSAVNDGFNCYIVTMGAKNSGKSYVTIGPNDDGLVWLGLDKIKELIKTNKKADITTRMFVCSLEIDGNNIFDLLSGNLNNKITMLKDAFKMTVASQATYKECFNEDEVRKCLKTAVKNRKMAASSLDSTDNTFIFLVTFQMYNKFQHRYFKGKITHVKLASFDKMKTLNSELIRLTKGQKMDYQVSKLTEFLQDCFGGSAKTCVIGTINPSVNCTKESLATMNLLKSLKSVTNEISKSSEPEQIFSLKNDIERLLRGLKPENL